VPSLPAAARVATLRVLAALMPVAAVFLAVQLGRWSEWVPRGPIKQLTTTRAFEGLPSLSPDGQWLAYRSDASGNGDIIVSRIDGWQTVNLTATPSDDESDPQFSPDGTLIAFASSQSGISVMPRDGGAARHIAREGAHPSWTPDGRFLIYSVDTNPGSDFRGSTSEGWKVNVVTGSTSRITGGDFHEPAVSPHAFRVAYSGRSVDRANRRRVTSARDRVWTMSLDGSGEPVRVTNDNAPESSPLWSPDGRFLFFVSNRSGLSSIWRVRIDERTGHPRSAPVPVPTPGSQPTHLTRSADGRRLAWSDARPIQRALRIDFDADARTTRGAPVEITPGDLSWEAAEPSPDESRIVLSSTNGHLHVSRRDGRELQPLGTDPALDRRPRWSPDAQWIAFQSNRGGASGIWFIKPNGQGLRPLSWASGDLLSPVWSPDGQQLAVWDTSIAGCRILRVDQEGGPSETLPAVTQGGAFVPSDWSPDGKLIAGSVSGNVWFYSPVTRTYQQFRPGANPVWLADSRRLIFSYGGRIYMGDAVLRIAREIFALPDQQLDGPRLSRDNRHLYFTGSGTDANLWLMTLGTS
jgi:tricorn protease